MVTMFRQKFVEILNVYLFFGGGGVAIVGGTLVLEFLGNPHGNVRLLRRVPWILRVDLDGCGKQKHAQMSYMGGS